MYYRALLFYIRNAKLNSGDVIIKHILAYFHKEYT